MTMTMPMLWDWRPIYVERDNFLINVLRDYIIETLATFKSHFSNIRYDITQGPIDTIQIISLHLMTIKPVVLNPLELAER